MSALFPKLTGREVISAGLITAEMERRDDGVVIFAPIEFDGERVAVRGAWFHDVDPSDNAAIAAALEETLHDLHPIWRARREQEFAAVVFGHSKSMSVSAAPHAPT